MNSDASARRRLRTRLEVGPVPPLVMSNRARTRTPPPSQNRIGSWQCRCHDCKAQLQAFSGHRPSFGGGGGGGAAALVVFATLEPLDAIRVGRYTTSSMPSESWSARKIA